LIHAFVKTGRIISEDNKQLFSHDDLMEWKRAVREYRARLDADLKAVDLCFRLLHPSGRSETARQKRFASSELCVAVLNALKEGISSFAMEGVFFNAWLSAVCRRIHVPADERERLREHFGAELSELQQVLEQSYDRLPMPSWSDSAVKAIARIESARSVPDTWLGTPPGSLHEARWEMRPSIEHLSYALNICAAPDMPEDLMEAMCLRSWARMRVLNERTDERFFQTLDQHRDKVHAGVQSHMARYSGPPLQ
jgi:hypothetical protein